MGGRQTISSINLDFSWFINFATTRANFFVFAGRTIIHSGLIQFFAHIMISFLQTRMLAHPVGKSITHSTFGCFFHATKATPLLVRIATGRAVLMKGGEQ